MKSEIFQDSTQGKPMDPTVFHPDFKAAPYWWDDITMGDDPPQELPARADVVIVGGGLTGLNCAIELGRGGAHAVVLDAEPLGFGASTRNGGGVSGGNNVGKGLSGAKGRQGVEEAKAEMRAIMADGLAGLNHIEGLIAREDIDCHYERTGRFVGAWTPKHYDGMAAKAEVLNELAEADAAHGPARPAAGGDRLRLLPRRHGGEPHRQDPSGALSPRADGGGAEAWRDADRHLPRAAS